MTFRLWSLSAWSSMAMAHLVVKLGRWLGRSTARKCETLPKGRHRRGGQRPVIMVPWGNIPSLSLRTCSKASANLLVVRRFLELFLFPVFRIPS